MINKVNALIHKGVRIPNPESVFISDDIDPARISGDNVTLYAGTKLVGKNTLIMSNTTIGYEAPVTLENTLVGKGCQLNGGYFKQTVLAGSNQFGSGAHVREGTILEEEANAAHTVGLKQTILFPFVTLGSLINFCDCLMAGGTSRKNHSEVGSSFIHFNYTPNQDKATPSMMGDVPRGVLLRSNPIFLGGQGGIVGPLKIEYGCMSAAGSILRKDELNPDRLLIGGAFRDMSMPRQPAVYKNIGHIFNNNIDYIASLITLNSWYTHIRPLFAKDSLSQSLVLGLQQTIETCIEERINRFSIFCDKLLVSRELIIQNKASKKNLDNHNSAIGKKDQCLETFEKSRRNIHILNQTGEQVVKKILTCAQNESYQYISTIKGLTAEDCDLVIKWLNHIQQSIQTDLLI